MSEHVDVIIVGGGLSGVGAASHLRRENPEESVLVLESRSTIGGTWDLFRYPGVRSDSDMFTLGYSFRPWTAGKAIADGRSIREYIVDTVEAEGLRSRIRTNHRVVAAEWSSSDARWTVTAVVTGDGEYRMDDGADMEVQPETAGQTETVTFTCSFLFVCSGYYRYDKGFTPAIPGADTFEGALVHPQHWPRDLDHAGKRVVVIGSGATAVTLVPSMAATAAHVTMLQRSPTYIAAVPSRDHLADRLRGKLPPQTAYRIIRIKNIGYSMLTYQLSRRRPEFMKSLLRKSAVAKLPAGFAVDTHLAPTYEPWDQRLCAIPDGDLYRAISKGAADIVTDRIDRITPHGIRLASGAELEADVIVTATGLELLVIGGIALSVDGRPVDVADTIAYKGMMLTGVPNFALTIGYTNASWTLKADLVARFVGRLLRRMRRLGYASVVPEAPASVRSGPLSPLIDLQAGYVLRSSARLPRQGAVTPWRLKQNYLHDYLLLRIGSVTDGLRYSRAISRRNPSSGTERSAEPALPSKPGEAFVTVDGARIRYRDTGSGSPILLIHGIGQSLEDWNEQHDRLSRDHRVLSLDLPGFGFSERPDAPVTLRYLADSLPGFLDALGIGGPVAVLGNSLGGAVAMTFAVAHPERVGALVLANSAGFGREVTIVLRLLAVKPIGSRLMRPAIANSVRTVRSLFYDQTLATAERIQHSYLLAQRPGHSATILDVARDLGTFRGVRPEWRSELLEALAALQIPTLAVWGDHDHVLPPHHLDAAIDALPNVESHVFAKTGHMPQIERPDEFARLVEDFLTRTPHSGSRKGSDSGALQRHDAAVGPAIGQQHEKEKE
ncbi:alpha/beta fold hydrolase [Naasia lichenicola]|uniref:alpha/beta fold hydrolase n=1 Tax=Naasia lichenicola TaxID=2565933 RepID=UPI00130D7852|nr:alpha/beta fold hydrolase [Naasia lichenicola]